MTKILVHIEARAGTVQAIAFELLAAAATLAGPLGAEIEAVVIGPLGDGEARKLGAAARVTEVVHPAVAAYTPEAHLLALAAVVERSAPDLLLLGYTSVGLDLAPAIAVRTGRPLVSYCVRMAVTDGAIEAESQVYGGKLRATTRTALPAVIAVVPGSFATAEIRVDGNPVVERIETLAGAETLGTRFVSETLPDADAIDLTQADRILCVGRGIGGADQIGEAEEVARLLGAEIAGSRPVIDAGWLPKPRQVGKSGTRVKPKLYLAIGVSGAPEHLEGMAASDLIIAVNSDAAAPIFGVAHYGATCDLFELLPALSEQLKG